MNNNHISIFVALSDEDKILEQKLENQKYEVGIQINEAIKNHQPYKELRDLEDKLYSSIMSLKGYVYADKGLRMPRNSTELAQEIVPKAKKIAYLEEEYIDSQLDTFRNEMKSIKSRVEAIVLFSIEHGLDKKFDDFKRIIRYWEYEKADIFDKPERCRPAYGANSLFMLEKNLVGYYIYKLRSIQLQIGELNKNRTKTTQAKALISICEIVISAEDDNSIFDQLFLMGQYSANLNSIKLGIKASIAKDRSRRSSAAKSDWAHELAQQVYLRFWIYGQTPTAKEVERALPDIVNNRNIRTVSDQLTNQRREYSNVDDRVLPVETKGRNKKV